MNFEGFLYFLFPLLGMFSNCLAAVYGSYDYAASVMSCRVLLVTQRVGLSAVMRYNRDRLYSYPPGSPTDYCNSAVKPARGDAVGQFLSAAHCAGRRTST